jgi:hypothetical protein
MCGNSIVLTCNVANIELPKETGPKTWMLGGSNIVHTVEWCEYPRLLGLVIHFGLVDRMLTGI